MEVRITKCYLVQVLDNEGNQVASEYVFGDKEAARESGKTLKAIAQEEYEKDIED